MDKKELRIKAKEIRKTLDVKDISKNICKNIRNLEVYKSSKNVMIFYPMKYEISLLELLNDGKNFYLPKVFNSGKLKVGNGKLNNFQLSTFNFQQQPAPTLTLPPGEGITTLPSPGGKVSEGRKGVESNYQFSTFNFQLIKADATNLPFYDNSFDIVIIGFGLRNIENFDRAIQEIYRVLKPNGQFLHLDFGEKNFLNKMFDKIVPIATKIFTRNNSAYSYLIKSKQEFFTPEELIKTFENKGLKCIKSKDYLFKTISCQILEK